MKRFHGWEPEQVTHYEYNQYDGIEKTTTVTEPEWDEEQQALVLALLAVEADTCPGCGLPLSETTEDVLDANGEVDPVKSAAQYVVKPASRCHACQALHQVKPDDYMEPESLRLSITKRG